jgi:signal transduction histidine kinase
VFSALPVFDDGGVIGVVLQSRTSETAEEWLWRQRRDLLYWGLAVLLLGSALFVGFSRIIERPLRSMSRAAEAIAEGKPPEEPLRGISGPKEVQILAEALANMSEKLEHRSHYIQDFVATVSHELKSPLTSIRGAAELLVEQWETIPDEKRQLFLENIQAAAERTTRLAQRLLALAREENPGQHSPLERVRLDAIRRGILERYPEHVRVEVRRPDASRDLAPERLDTVLGNLLDNALRYRASKPVLLSLDVDQTERLVIEVENDGPPISAANQERLFQRFFTTERDRGGTGLGLAMVKAIAEASGGSVDVQSNSQRTRFQVLL